MTALFFNLLTNSTFSMIGGLLFVMFIIWFFRVDTGYWKLFLLSLPFAKIVYDALRGLPADSILLAGLDPYTLPARHQLLRIGTGFSYWGPRFDVAFATQDTSGREYSASVGDYLVIWLNRTFGSEILLVLLVAVLAISIALIGRRLISIVKFERKRRADRAHAESLQAKGMDFRTVDIYISETFTGTPFTGGTLKPYICIPADAFRLLNQEELKAVIAHELGHIKHCDLAVTLLVQLLGDVFWFIPGYRWLSRKIDRLREIVADQWALRSGATPMALASALVNLKELPGMADGHTLYSALFRERSLLKVRVDRLLGKAVERKPRFGWGNICFRTAVSIWIVAGVMSVTFGGNHSALELRNPDWFNALMKDMGLEVLNVESE